MTHMNLHKEKSSMVVRIKMSPLGLKHTRLEVTLERQLGFRPLLYTFGTLEVKNVEAGRFCTGVTILL